MAESAVSFLLNQLAVVIKDERKLFGGLRSKVVYIEGQLRMMQAFLRVADAKEDSDPQLKEWVTQVRELAYDIEDVLDMFMYRFGHLRNQANGFLGGFKKAYAAMKNYDARRDVALQLTEMESRVKTMYEQHLGYQSRYRDEQNASSSYFVDYKFDGRGDARLVEENMLVGIEGPKRITEEVGACYLNELIYRNLVQEKEIIYQYGRPNGCCMHDIVREVVVDKSIEQNFVNTQSGKNSTFTKLRRIANHGSADTIRETSNLKHLRSMVLIASTDSMHEQYINILATGGCKLLKVLFLQNAPLEMIPNDVFKLYLLTYLNLYGTKVKVIPKSIGKLVYLETLNLEDTDVIHIPIQILKLQRLCRLYAFKEILRRDHLSGTYQVQSFSAPYRIGRLSSLKSLAFVDADKVGDTSIVREIGKLTQLETLGVCKLRRKDGKDLCFSLEKLSHLHTLSVTSITDDEIIDLDHPLSSIPRFLKVVCLEGRMEKVPHWIPSLRELTKVRLVSSKLSQDPLELLEDLPNLGTLILTDAFEGTTLHFKAEKFSSLRDLQLLHLSRLTSIVVEKDSTPNLLELRIWYCKQVLELPIGLDHLAKLQEFKVWDMNDKFVEAFENGKASNEKLVHISMAVWNLDQGNWKYL